MQGVPLLRNDYRSATRVYPIRKPEILSGETYSFISDSGLTYEVTFGKKKNNYLGNILNFSVISDEYEDEYSETNRGEVYRIISTVTEILRIYHENHPFSNSYEFSGEFRKKEEKQTASVRTRLYFRAATKSIDPEYWDILLEGNKVLVKRKFLHE